MNDSRAALVYSDLWAAATKETMWLIDVGEVVWDALGEVCSTRGSALRCKCIAAGHVTFHFSIGES